MFASYFHPQTRIKAETPTEKRSKDLEVGAKITFTENSTPRRLLTDGERQGQRELISDVRVQATFTFGLELLIEIATLQRIGRLFSLAKLG